MDPALSLPAKSTRLISEHFCETGSPDDAAKSNWAKTIGEYVFSHKKLMVEKTVSELFQFLLVALRSTVTWRKQICRTVWAREDVAFINVAPIVRLAVPVSKLNKTHTSRDGGEYLKPLSSTLKKSPP